MFRLPKHLNKLFQNQNELQNCDVDQPVLSPLEAGAWGNQICKAESPKFLKIVKKKVKYGKYDDRLIWSNIWKVLSIKADEGTVEATKRRQAIKKVAAGNIWNIWKETEFQIFEWFLFSFWIFWLKGGKQSRRFLCLWVFPSELSSSRRQECNSHVEKQRPVTLTTDCS